MVVEVGRHAWDVELVAVEPAAATVACFLVVVEVRDQLVVAVAMAAAPLPMVGAAVGHQTHLNCIKNNCLLLHFIFHNHGKCDINYHLINKRKTEAS